VPLEWKYFSLFLSKKLEQGNLALATAEVANLAMKWSVTYDCSEWAAVTLVHMVRFFATVDCYETYGVVGPDGLLAPDKRDVSHIKGWTLKKDHLELLVALADELGEPAGPIVDLDLRLHIRRAIGCSRIGNRTVVYLFPMKDDNLAAWSDISFSNDPRDAAFFMEPLPRVKRQKPLRSTSVPAKKSTHKEMPVPRVANDNKAVPQRISKEDTYEEKTGPPPVGCMDREDCRLTERDCNPYVSRNTALDLWMNRFRLRWKPMAAT
jgi:hypothetical protein